MKLLSEIAAVFADVFAAIDKLSNNNQNERIRKKTERIARERLRNHHHLADSAMDSGNKKGKQVENV